MSTDVDKSRIPAALDHPTVFFDGVCGLCNQTVNWLLAHDSERRLRFAPLQGITAMDVVPEEIRTQMNTLVFVVGKSVYLRTAAVSRILLTLSFPWNTLGAGLWLIPGPIRDLGYRAVSSQRYRLFGKHDACRLPTAEERAVFLE